jgi:hypothetical protein
MRISLALALPMIAWVGCGSGASSTSGDQSGQGVPDADALDSGQAQDGTSPSGDAAATSSDGPGNGTLDGSARDSGKSADTA